MNNKIAQTSTRISRINCLVSKMLSNNQAQTGSDSCTESAQNSRNSSLERSQSRPQKQAQTQTSVNPALKRNLFGIKLNHDQLKTDLNKMWKEQLEIQKLKWNFDFENLKPVQLNNSNNNSNNSNNGNEEVQKFKWNKINLVVDPLGDLKSSLIENNELKSSSNENDKENSNELMSLNSKQIPSFYKYQRTFKLIDEKNRLNLLNINNNNNNNQEKESSKEPVNIKSELNKQTLIKPKAIKTNKKDELNKNQIITFSENRKDTLRSATCSNTSSNKIQKSEQSAFKQQEPKLKQQSLLDMFKQRKRRINLNNKESKSTKIEASNNQNSRPQSAQINSTN